MLKKFRDWLLPPPVWASPRGGVSRYLAWKFSRSLHEDWQAGTGRSRQRPAGRHLVFPCDHCRRKALAQIRPQDEVPGTPPSQCLKVTVPESGRVRVCPATPSCSPPGPALRGGRGGGCHDRYHGRTVDTGKCHVLSFVAKVTIR